MKNENLSLDDFIKRLRNLGVKLMSLELIPNQSVPPLRCDTLLSDVDQQTIDRTKRHEVCLSALKTNKDENIKGPDTINADAQKTISKDGGVLVGEKPVTAEKLVTPKKPAPKSKQVATRVKEIKPVDQFERFVHLVEHDDGSKENAAERKAIVNKLKLDDLLRINNEFSCGVDTDCKMGELRTTILSLF